jgi:hypothetical protein
MSDPKPKEEPRVLHLANGSTLTFGPGDVGDQFDGTAYEYLLIDDEDEYEGLPC